MKPLQYETFRDLKASNCTQREYLIPHVDLFMRVKLFCCFHLLLFYSVGLQCEGKLIQKI